MKLNLATNLIFALVFVISCDNHSQNDVLEDVISSSTEVVDDSSSRVRLSSSSSSSFSSSQQQSGDYDTEIDEIKAKWQQYKPKNVATVFVETPNVTNPV